MEKFIVTPKEDKSVTMTIRIDRAEQNDRQRGGGIHKRRFFKNGARS